MKHIIIEKPHKVSVLLIVLETNKNSIARECNLDACFDASRDPDTAHPSGPPAHRENVTPVTGITASFVKLIPIITFVGDDGISASMAGDIIAYLVPHALRAIATDA